MVRKKIDNRIRVLIENGVATGHRTMFVVIGDHARDQVNSTKLITLHYVIVNFVYVSVQMNLMKIKLKTLRHQIWDHIQ